MLSFMPSWRGAIHGLMITASGTQKTLTAGAVVELIRGDVFYWGLLLTGALVASVPVVIACGSPMDYYVSGLVTGATKY